MTQRMFMEEALSQLWDRCEAAKDKPPQWHPDEASAFFWRPPGTAKVRRRWRRRNLPNTQREAKT